MKSNKKEKSVLTQRQQEDKRIVNITMASDAGDTLLSHELGEAIGVIIAKHFQNNQTVWAGGTLPFIFTAESENDPVALLQDAVRLRQLLLDNDGEEIRVRLTGSQFGGQLAMWASATPVQDYHAGMGVGSGILGWAFRVTDRAFRWIGL